MRGNKKDGPSEANILNECLLALSGAGCLVWRNNTGQLPDKTGRPIKFGLCIGSSDIIGVARDGRFIAIECKTAIGQPTDAQIRFLNRVTWAGGRAGIARSAEDAVKIAVDLTP
jgi:hypothetical protein